MLLFIFLVGAASSAQADDCSSHGGVIDGTVVNPAPSQINIDTNCTIRNFQDPNELISNISFYTSPGQTDTRHLVIFDNVTHTGNMSCNSTHEHKIWFTNGSASKIMDSSCQNLVIPVEKIDKSNPAPTATVGIPFTYTMAIPVFYDPATGSVLDDTGSPNPLGTITIRDDLSTAAIGADLTYLEHKVYWKEAPDSPLTSGTDYTFSDGGGQQLEFSFPPDFSIPAYTQLMIELTVVLDDTPANTAGTMFRNTASWEFARWIDVNENGIEDEGEYFNPLPGESGVTEYMTIAEPDLLVTKESTATALNIGVVAPFTIDVQNIGGEDAWEVTIDDILPDNGAGAGMCEYDPLTLTPGLTAEITDAGGNTLRPLTAGTDYLVNYNSCDLSLTVTEDGGQIAPGQHLLINFSAQLDSDTSADGETLTNIAGATRWFNAASSFGNRRQYDRTLNDGTPGIDDHQDSYSVTTGLSGYYFEKTVVNRDTGVGPGPDMTAAPGDTLRYQLRLFNVDQTIDGVTITDSLDSDRFDLSSFSMVTRPANTTFSLTGNELVVTGAAGTPLNVDELGELIVEFDITLLDTLTTGTEAHNQASLTADQGTPANTDDDFVAISDDPYLNGVAAPDDPDDNTTIGDEDPTIVTIQTPGPLSKAKTQDTASIGERFSYAITVPADPVDVSLFDVRVEDVLPDNVEMEFVGAEVLAGGDWTLTNTGTATAPVLEDTISGIDVPAGGQAEIEITFELLNTEGNQSGLSFVNSASYTYNRRNDDSTTTMPGGGDTSGEMTIVEPDLVAEKAVSFFSPADKQPTDAATVGDVLEYAVTITNNGDSTAFDTSVVDTLPPDVSLVTGSATAQIEGVDVDGFVVTPTTLPNGDLVWGGENGDGSFDIPADQTLVLTYRVTVESVTGTDITNSVHVDWTSLDGGSTAERSGDGCPVTTALDDYCFGPATASPINTVDNTSISKSAIDDSYGEEPASTTDRVLRVGDTVTYELTLSLQEYTTGSVVVQDTLPTGMALESFSIEHGGTNFIYSLETPPQPGDTGLLEWNFGDITNEPDGTSVDQLVIRYVAEVVVDDPDVGVGYDTSILLDNAASLTYTGGDPEVYPDRLTATTTIEVRQPQMSAITKVDLGTDRTGSGTELDPYQVDIANDEMLFQLSSCNAGLAPAYGVVITDLLAGELDEADLTANSPVVKIGDTTLQEGSDYSLTVPAREGEMRITLLDSAPVAPTECVTVDYSIGFHTDLTSETTWNNAAQLAEYWSLPTDGRSYTSTESAQVWMTNLVNVEPLSKELVSPNEATIGEEVIYTIRVPGEPVNAAFENVVVTDELHAALEYVGATAVDLNGDPVALVDSSVGNSVELAVEHIPAGQKAIITLTARVANNADANAGTSFRNAASYTYEGMPVDADTSDDSGALTIVEPELAIAKEVANVTSPDAAPKAGDTLRYSVTFTASGGTNFSDAFDLLIEDSLSLGLVYETGTATVDGTDNTITDPATNGGDGITTAQTLTWSLADATADIDVPEGSTLTVTYDVLVLDSVLAGQELTNSANVQWTGIDGDDAFERDGSGAPDVNNVNDYFTGPATTTLNTLDSTTLTKSRVTDTWEAGTDVRVGDLIDYELRIQLDEGSHSGLTLSDVLPQGLQFEEVVSINGETTAPYSAVAPFSHADIAAPVVGGDAASGTSTVTWTLGDIVNAADGDSSNDKFVIIYRARVLNDSLAQTDSTTLSNTATLDYNTATETASQTDGESATLLQPHLTVGKSAAPEDGDSAISAGELITYTVDVTNTGAAPAYDPVVQDTLPVGLRQGGVTTTSITLVAAGTELPLLQPDFDPATGTAIWDFDTGAADAYTIPANDTLRITYTVNADDNLGPSLTLANSVLATDYYSFDNDAVPTAGTVSGVRQHYGPSNIDTVELITPVPGAPLKESPDDATIGEEFTYTITVPAEPLPTALHDVRLLDDLGQIAADVTLVSIDKIEGSGSWTPVNTSGSTNLVIEDTANGIDIPANEQIRVGITLRLDNTTANNAGDTFTNTASYTYSQVDGDGVPVDGGSSEAAMEVAESALSVSKTATPLATPITGGSVIEYAVTMDNSGGSTAFDVNVSDTLPPELTLYSGFTPTATINGTAVPGFVSTPAGAPDGPLVWGEGNGDGSLDVPVDGQLVITYQAQVQVSTAATIENEVWVDWTSLNGESSYERTGAGCPTTTEPDEYCAGPANATIEVTDSNSLEKSVVSDSYVDAPSTASDATLRIGDSAIYQLEVNLAEGTTAGVSVSDVLPEGMAFDSLIGITQSSGGDFGYTLASQPVAGDTGTLTWDFGDITNTPSGDDTPVDTLTIEYTATVLPDAGIAQQPATTLTNSATLSYVDGSGTTVLDPARLESEASLTLWQPVMDGLSKTDRQGRVGTSATPLSVDVATDTMQFRLESCNSTGQAPAYDVVLTDVLPSQLDETSLTIPVVSVGGAVLDTGDYSYTPPVGRGDSLSIQLNTPVDPGQCVTVDYDIGFHTDFGPDQTWNNSVTLDEYWSLPLQSGQVYGLVGPAEFWMTNQATIDPPSKVLTSTSEATIGEEVTYEIRVPANPANAALYDLVVSDTMHGSLEYLGATEISGNTLSLTDNTDATVAPTELNLVLDRIPAGEQAVIEVTARVANNAAANAGTSFNNSVSYTYAITDGGIANPGGSYTTTDPLTIVEPELAIAKQVANVTNPGAAPNPGDILRYSVSFTAGGGEAGDDFSDAFDLLIEDSLSLGLAYQNGTASVDGGNTITDPGTNGGDGISTAQTLTWSLADATADIDVVEGTVVTLDYDVLVLDGVRAGQELTNSATVQWTGLDGDSTLERDGTGTPEVNDYFTGPATTTLMTEFAVSFVKSVVNATTGEDPGANAQPGDTLRYTLVISNESIASLNNASVVDELAAHFAPGSLQVLSVSDANADTTNTSATGGVNGTGIVDIRNLTLAPQGDAGDTLTIVFEATLAPAIDSGTTVLNQAQLTGDALASATSNETSTLISSAPAFEVWKSSLDISDDPSELRAGDTLRYTLTVKNVGNEDAINAVLHDQLPTNTSYVPESTTLNGAPVADQSPGVLPLQDGIPLHAPEDPTPGVMRADAGSTSDNIATITFDVVIDADVFSGTIIANQGFVSADGAGSGPMPQEPSDDPDTTVADDPTRDIVGSVPLLDAHKTVVLHDDANSNNIVDPGDLLRYSIVVTNTGSAPATEAVLVDAVPANTSYVPDSVILNGLPVGQPDGGTSPLASGIAISSSDLTPPLPAAGEGTLSVGGSAVVTFDVEVNAGVASGTIISNQGVVQSNEQLDEPTDADGLDSNGDQPTEVVVGDAQQLSISKEVFVVGGGAAVPGSTLEYVVRVTNIGGVPATDVVITDDLDTPVPGQLTYVSGSGLLNGLATGVSFVAPVLTADYSAHYGVLDPGASAILRFRAQIDPALAVGTTITNTAEVSWNTPVQTATSSVSIDLGGTPGAVSLSGAVWHDANFNTVADAGESLLPEWSVDVYRNNRLLGSVVTDENGAYRIQGLAATDASSAYELRFRAPGAGANTALLGEAHSSYTNGLQRISDITAAEGSSVGNLNLPITPNGVVYDSVLRTPIAGAAVAMLRAGSELPGSCFDDPSQQGQITSLQGHYKFDINFSDPACVAGGDYTLRVTPPASGYTGWPSRIIPPLTDESSPAFSVPGCLGGSDDAVATTAEHCEAQTSEYAPALSVRARSPGTNHHLHLTLDGNRVPGESQLFNNHIPVDPELDAAIAITKTSSRVNVSRGEHVPYTITIRNTLGTTLQDLSIVDNFPAGFKYVEGSGRIDGQPVEPEANGLQLTWSNLELGAESRHTIQMLFVVGSGVSEGEYINRARAINSLNGEHASGEASATVRVVPDPTFDCTDITGKVFDDANLDGEQDGNEKGLPGVRLVTARGLIAKTDEHGRFHITCAAVPNESRGSNFILKLDDRSLPTGFRVTTENPRVQRVTRGKMMRFNFGATVHRVVRLDVADGVFEPDSTEMRLQWKPRMELLLEELRKSPSVVRIAYLADVEEPSLVKRRLRALRKSISGKWEELNCCYPLTVETETFWRRGAPPKR
ncbi:isopeptide-forming domain-containing fimbrial protein [Thiohalomonas denitrificans]|uniref:isopeptide-forming domain-containing fimbrial protein n=1 Tax=Thiohalomonas denitrificans TaxID=415747 RepID=UPI0015862C02|nr:isopeptide-forming domain-containing fimbrial protein [Thiohalomonas denitrificans]